MEVKFITKPFFTINFILKLLFEYTIALGGVEIGIIKAQLADRMNGSKTWIKSKLFEFAKTLKIGNNKNVVAVLLVNSVNNEVNILDICIYQYIYMYMYGDKYVVYIIIYIVVDHTWCLYDSYTIYEYALHNAYVMDYCIAVIVLIVL